MIPGKGWALIGRARTFHYYDEARFSLCGRYRALFAPNEAFNKDDGTPGTNDCASCARKAAELRALAPVEVDLGTAKSTLQKFLDDQDHAGFTVMEAWRKVQKEMDDYSSKLLRIRHAIDEALPPYNIQLNPHNGQEDPGVAAYVEGVGTIYQPVDRILKGEPDPELEVSDGS